MGAKATIHAAGVVVFREKNGRRQVLLVHRPAYDDWTLPKGKPKPDEDLPVAAVRETREETGVRVRLGVRLEPVRYRVPKGPKVVYFWVGQFLGQRPRRPDGEVDKVKWFDLDEARQKMSYADEVRVLDEALARNGTTRALLIVRHAKAMDRKHWTGPDQNRTISARGRRQSARLVDLLAAYGVTRVVTSSSKRCVLTVQPFCEEYGVRLEKVALLSEEEAEGRERDVAKYIARLAKKSTEVVAMCGHRPVLPAMQSGAGVEPRPMLTAEVLVVHYRNEKPVSVEAYKSAF